MGRRLLRGAALRRDMARRLPGQVRALLADYDAFLAAAPAAPDPEDIKGWAARHAAGKAALQHVDILLKLLRWAEAGEAGECESPAAPPGAPPESDDLNGLLARARAALGEERGEEEDDDDDDRDG